MAINARPEEGAYAEGRAARRRGAERGFCPYAPGLQQARWQVGGDDEDFALRRPADDERAAILRAGPGPGHVVERPRPRVVQIAVAYEGLLALMDDGALWYRRASTPGGEQVWSRVPGPDEETPDGR